MIDSVFDLWTRWANEIRSALPLLLFAFILDILTAVRLLRLFRSSSVRAPNENLTVGLGVTVSTAALSHLVFVAMHSAPKVDYHEIAELALSAAAILWLLVMLNGCLAITLRLKRSR